MLLTLLIIAAAILVPLALVKHYIMKTKTLYIIRGVPGSGKSTLASKMASEMNIAYFEADMFFLNKFTGEYVFDRDFLHQAHNWCFNKALEKFYAGESFIVSNTFTRWREMREYYEAAKENGYNVEIIHCHGDFHSIHNVPEETVKRMRERFIPNEALPQIEGVKYSVHVPAVQF